jgi:hypothetical protein
MGWRMKAFGAEHPTPRRYLAMVALYAFLVLVFYGLATDFLPEPAFAIKAAWIAGVFALALTAWLGGWTLSGCNPNFRGSKWRLAWLLPLMVALAFGFAWIAFARAVPSVATRVFGVDEALPPMVMWTDDSFHKSECSYQLRGGPLEGTFQGHLCVHADYFRAHPNHRVEVQLTGRRSFAGFAPRGFVHLRDLGPHRRS